MLYIGLYNNLIKALTDLAIIFSIIPCKGDEQSESGVPVKTGLPFRAKDNVLHPGKFAKPRVIHL
jgi:hypothetical protein